MKKIPAGKPNKERRLAVLPPLDDRQRYSIEEAAAYLRISRPTIYGYINAGDLRTIQEGRRRFVPGSEIVRKSSVGVAA